MSKFNLLDEKWIPTNMGHVSLIGLFDKKVEVTASPLIIMSIYRLATAIVASALQIENDEHAVDLIDDIDNSNKSVIAYLEKWRDRFYLYDDKYPFLQVASLESNKKFPIGMFDVLATYGAEQGIITDHQKHKVHTDADIALNLITYLNFAYNSKGKVDNTITCMESIEKKNEYYNANNIKLFDKVGINALNQAGISLSNPPDGQGYVHLYITGNDAITTAIMMSPTINESIELGKPVWELDSIKEDSHNLTSTHLGQLVPMGRFVKIIGNQFIATSGAIIKLEPETFLKLVIKPKNKPSFEKNMSVKSAWHLWLEFPEILSSLFNTTKSPAVNRAKNRSDADIDIFTLNVVFPVVKSSSGEVHTIASEHKISYYLDDINRADEEFNRMQTMMGKINRICSLIDKHETEYFKKAYSKPKVKRNNIANAHFKYRLLNKINIISNSNYQDVKHKLMNTAIQSLEQVCDPNTADKRLAYANVITSFKAKLNKLAT